MGNDPDALIGQWALIHVGFAMSLIDEDEAAKTLEALRDLGEAQETLDQMAASAARCQGCPQKFALEFRDPAAARALLSAIAR